MSEIDDDEVFFIKQGDLEPPLELLVGGSAGDLSTVETWHVIGSHNGTVVFDDPDATFTPGANLQSGVVKHAWVAGETDVLGSMDIETRAIWPGDRPQTFPPKNYCRVVVSKKLA